jgi:hypothetical protein
MNFDLTRSFNQNEKIALLKLLIKVAGSDKKITHEKQKTLKQYLVHNHLKVTKDFVNKSLNEDIEGVVSDFTNKTNLKRACKVTSELAKLHGISTEHEAIILNQIKIACDSKEKKIKFNLIDFFKTLGSEFAFLWGKEDINPNFRKVLAIVFTTVACLFGSIWTYGHFFGIWISSEIVMPEFSALISGLIIFGALCFRGYLPKPKKVRNIIFTIADIYLLSTIAMHILGRGSFGKGITFLVFGSLILLLWLGMKEILGFVFVGFFLMLAVNVVLLDFHIVWKAFPFIFSAFMGISFQSTNLFSDFTNISSSFFKKPEIDNEFVKESLHVAGQQTVTATKNAFEVGIEGDRFLTKKAFVMGTEVEKISAKKAFVLGTKGDKISARGI